MALSLGGVLAALLKANDENPSIVSCRISGEGTELIIHDFAAAVRPGIDSYRQRILTPSELQELTFG